MFCSETKFIFLNKNGFIQSSWSNVSKSREGIRHSLFGVSSFSFFLCFRSYRTSQDWFDPCSSQGQLRLLLKNMQSHRLHRQRQSGKETFLKITTTDQKIIFLPPLCERKKIRKKKRTVILFQIHSLYHLSLHQFESPPSFFSLLSPIFSCVWKFFYVFE